MMHQQQKNAPWLWLLGIAAFVLFLYYGSSSSERPANANSKTAGAASAASTGASTTSTDTSLLSLRSSSHASTQPSPAFLADLARRLAVVEYRQALLRPEPEPEALDGRLITVAADYASILPHMRKRINRVRKARGVQPTEPKPVALDNSRITMVTPTDFHKVYPAELVIEEIQKFKVWAELETGLANAVLQRECRARDGGPAPLMVDVGAHIGYFSTLGLNNGCDVVYVEPFVESTLWFQLTLAFNGAIASNTSSAQAYIYNAICSDQVSSNLVFNGWNAATHEDAKFVGLKQPAVNAQWSSAAISVDLAVDGLPPASRPRDVAFWKMDIEGHEPHGFASAKGLLKAQRIKYLMFESTFYLYHKEIPGIVEAFELLADCGYVLYEVVGNTIVPISTAPGTWKLWYADAMVKCKATTLQYCQTNFYGHLKSLPSLLDISAPGKVRATFTGH